MNKLLILLLLIIALKAFPQSKKDIKEQIEQYKKNYNTCRETESDSCADITITLASLYYDYAISMNMHKTISQKYNFAVWYKECENYKSAKPYLANAFELFMEAIRKYPDSEKIDEAYYQIADMFLMNGDIENSKKYFIQLVSKHPKSRWCSAAHFRLSQFYLRSEEFDSALVSLNQIKEEEINNQTYVISTYNKGIAYYKKGKFDLAKGYFTKLQEDYKSNISFAELIKSIDSYLDSIDIKTK